jgi:hypothetical protein
MMMLDGETLLLRVGRCVWRRSLAQTLVSARAGDLISAPADPPFSSSTERNTRRLTADLSLLEHCHINDTHQPTLDLDDPASFIAQWRPPVSRLSTVRCATSSVDQSWLLQGPSLKSSS